MLTRTEQLNASCNKHYSPRDLTSFEIELFNSTKTNVNPDNYDLTNAEIVNSLNIYFDTIEPNATKFLYTAQKLLDLGDSRGALRLGTFYSPNIGEEIGLEPQADVYKAIEYYKQAAEMGSPYANINLGTMYRYAYEFQKSLNYYKLAAEIDKIPSAYMAITSVYAELNDAANVYTWAQKGIKSECPDCFKVMQSIIEGGIDNESLSQCDRNTIFYIYLTQLPFTNDMIKNYLKDNLHRINQTMLDNPKKIVFTSVDADNRADCVFIAGGPVISTKDLKR